MDISSIHGGCGVIFQEDSGASMDSASIRKAIFTSLKWITDEYRNSARAKARTLHISSASRYTRRGNESCIESFAVPRRLARSRCSEPAGAETSDVRGGFQERP